MFLRGFLGGIGIVEEFFLGLKWLHLWGQGLTDISFIGILGVIVNLFGGKKLWIIDGTVK